LETELEGEPLVAVLIDGDGAIVTFLYVSVAFTEADYMNQFDERFLTAGRDGGKEAASILRRHVTEQCRDIIGTGDVQLYTRIFVNQAGMAGTLDHKASSPRRLLSLVDRGKP
jgi:hypothetical protein